MQTDLQVYLNKHIAEHQFRIETNFKMTLDKEIARLQEELKTVPDGERGIIPEAHIQGIIHGMRLAIVTLNNSIEAYGVTKDSQW